MKRVEQAIEATLWSSRFLVLVAVAGSAVSAIVLLVISAGDVVYLIGHVPHYFDSALSAAVRSGMHDDMVTEVIKIIDGFLLATAALIFSFGIYELFISKIDIAEASHASSRILIVGSLDDLKSNLAKVILIILIVTLFENVLKMKFDEPLELLYVGGCIALIALALKLAHAPQEHIGADAPPADRSHGAGAP